jgi:hypothetical protein
LNPRAAPPQTTLPARGRETGSPRNYNPGMSVPFVFALLLITGVVVIGLLVLVALAVVLRSSPDAPAKG